MGDWAWGRWVRGVFGVGGSGGGGWGGGGGARPAFTSVIVLYKGAILLRGYAFYY